MIRLDSSLLAPLSRYFSQTEIDHTVTAIFEFMLVEVMFADLEENVQYFSLIIAYFYHLTISVSHSMESQTDYTSFQQYDTGKTTNESTENNSIFSVKFTWMGQLIGKTNNICHF